MYNLQVTKLQLCGGDKIANGQNVCIHELNSGSWALFIAGETMDFKLDNLYIDQQIFDMAESTFKTFDIQLFWASYGNFFFHMEFGFPIKLIFGHL